MVSCKDYLRLRCSIDRSPLLIIILGAHTPSAKEHIQTSTANFPIEEKYQDAWDYGLQLLGRPLTARLTSYSNCQYLDVYYQ